MRMWMVPPEMMCRKHLLGEHVEIHMLAGSLRRKRSIEGHLAAGQLEPQSIHRRHAALVAEMRRRGYRHQSPLLPVDGKTPHGLVDVAASTKELQKRCPDCRARMNVRRKTITREELTRLAFCNSTRLPRKVNVDGRLREWVGIGWIDIGPFNRRYTTVEEV